MSRINICGIPVDAVSMQETLNIIDQSIRRKKFLHHVVVNAAKIVSAQKDFELKQSIVNCDLINADGQSVVWASRLLNKWLPERVTGIDLMEELIGRAATKGYRIFFLGAQEEVVAKVVNMYRAIYGAQIIAGFRNGYFTDEDEESVANEIATSKADILFVAMTSPRKEVFLQKHKDKIRTPFIMGVGGSFDVISGLVKRAPLWMQKSGLEWLYRLLQEPRRLGRRYLVGNTQFIFLVIMEKLHSLIGSTRRLPQH